MRYAQKWGRFAKNLKCVDNHHVDFADRGGEGS